MHKLLYLLFTGAALAQTPSFGPPSALAAQRASLAITSADFNGDGVPDLAVANAASSTVSIFLGTGGGAFSTATSVALFPVMCQPAYLTNGNFTGGPGPDVLVVCPLGPVVVLPNKGHGTFGAPVTTVLPAPAWVGNLLLGDIHPAIGDFNGDGHLDVAVPTFDLNSVTGNWLLLLGKGTGAFQTPTVLPFSGLVPLSLAAGDFDGDGKLDLVTVVADLNGSVSLEFAAGKGDGTFAAPVLSSLAFNTGSILMATDVNGDGKLDVIIAGASLLSNITALAKSSGSGESSVTVLLGDGKGGFKAIFSASEPAYMSGAALANILGTGNLDLVETMIQGNFFAGDLPSGSVEVRPGNGDGTFGSPIVLSLPTTTVPTDVVATDLNGDGRPDIAFSSLPTHGVVLAGFSLDASLIGLLESVLEQLPSGNADVLVNQTTAPQPFSEFNAASFATGPLANGSIVAAFGHGLAESTMSAASLPLPTTLGNTSITIKDSSGASLLAPLFYVSPGQVNYAIPEETAAGPATITIQAGANVLVAKQQVAAVAPGLFAHNGLAVGSSVRDTSSGQQIAPLVQKGAAIPVDVSGGKTTLLLYGTGIRNHANAVVATIGNTQIPVAYASAQATFVGEDQINVKLPASLAGAGLISLSLLVDGQTTNSVQVLIQ